jgi:diaminohydroxyphosphoribosylaminopyrimidine deaminase / 5-amino-6-(5-phosphoribosylamino)uracil reductase
MTPVGISEVDRLFLQATVKLAEQGLFTTTPNPRVGSLLVRDGSVIGRGWHQRAGGPHAEAAALNDAASRGHSAAGATCYVSLEPCAHHGRTPPCSDALIAAGVTRVVAAARDPFPQVDGAGFERLTAAGIQVDVAELEAAQTLNAGYVKRVSQGLPWIRVKLAASLDGRTAVASGESKWITGSDARADVQYWRARSCAVVTGIGTVLADDPALTVRDQQYADAAGLRQPLRVVLDSALRTPADACLFDTAGPLLVVTADRATTKAPAFGARAELLRLAGARPDIAQVLRELARRGCNEVLIESGPKLAGEVLARGLWDEVLVYLAPKFLGRDGRPLADLQIPDMASALAGTFTELRAVGADLRLRMSRRDRAE